MTIEPAPEAVARAWHAYVSNKSTWTEAAWEAAADKKLAVKREGKMGTFWSLTDLGLDLFLVGCHASWKSAFEP